MSKEIEVSTLEQARSLASDAAKSNLFAVKRAEEALVILLTGRELGLGPMASLRGIHVVSGRPVLSADLLVAAVRGSGHCESWRVVETTAERCEIVTRRKGEQHVETGVWTRADAERAGLYRKPGPWQQYPAQMLRHRCAADLVRRVYPDVALGLYTPDEVDVIEQRSPQHVEIVQSPARELPLSVQRLADDLAQLGDGLSVEQITSVVREHYDAIAADGSDALIDAHGVAKAHAPAGAKGRVGSVFDDCGRALARQRAEAAQATALPAPEAPTRAVAVEAEETHPALVALRDALAQAGTLADVAARANEAAEELRSLTEGDRHLAWQMACAAAERVTGVDAREAAAKLRDAMRGPDGDGPRGGKRAKPKAAPADAAASSAAATASDATQARAASPESAHFVESAEAWEAHCLAYDSVFHLENGWAKHSPAFSAAGVYETRLETAALRLQAITAFAGSIDALKTRLRTVSRKADERALRATQAARIARAA